MVEAHKEMNDLNQISKMSLNYRQLPTERSAQKNSRVPVAGILEVIASLDLWHIQEVLARALATVRGHTFVTKEEDRSNTSTEMI